MPIFIFIENKARALKRSSGLTSIQRDIDRLQDATTRLHFKILEFEMTRSGDGPRFRCLAPVGRDIDGTDPKR
ncbi:MAG: hypothetical protein ACTSXP_09385 [Promethearchaeota archaeon]